MSKFRTWWDNESGWGSDAPILSEGKLAKDAWNAALKEAQLCIVLGGNPEIALEKIKALCEI